MSTKIKSIGFNMNDPDERMMLEHAESKKFSAYIKRLIYRDIFGGGKHININEQVQPVIEPDGDGAECFL